MAETGNEILKRLTDLINQELASLTNRLEIGGKTIDAELSETRKAKLLEGWSELDRVYKRLQLVHSILASPKEAPLTGVYCAVCLRLVEPEKLLEAGWKLPEEVMER